MFFGCFHFTNFLYHDYVRYFALCCCTVSATDLKELFLLSGVFYLTLLPDIWHNGMLHQPVFIKASLRAGSFSLKVQDLSLRFETQTQPIFLFESHSVKQKVLVDRFYLCVKALRNTISTSSRFWTHYLKAIYNTKRLCYLLGHRSS